MRGCVVLLLAACGAAEVRPQPSHVPEAIAGLWSVADGSDVVVRITVTGAQPTLEAWAIGDQTPFDVTGVSWDGRRLRATFVYQPNGVTTTSDVALAGKNRLEGTVSGAYSGRETWLRLEPSQ